MILYILKLLDWCKIKIKLSRKKSSILFKEGEIWWCHVGLNIREEEYGKGTEFARPVLIFKKFTTNSFLGLPLTGHERTGSWYVGVKMNDRISSIMLNQARIFDRKRLRERILTMGDLDFEVVREKFREFYCPLKLATPSQE